MQHLPSSPNELINEGTAAQEQIWLCGAGSSQGCLLTRDFLYDFLWFEWRWKALSCGKLFLQWGSNCISCLISASRAAEVTYIPPPSPPPHPCSTLERKASLPTTTTPKPAGLQCWEDQCAPLEPTIYLLEQGTSPWFPKEPDEDDTGLGFPWRMCLVLEEDGIMLSAVLLPSRC